MSASGRNLVIGSVACLLAIACPALAAPTWPAPQDTRSTERLFHPTAGEVDAATVDLRRLRDQHRSIVERFAREPFPLRSRSITRARMKRWASQSTLPRIHRDCLSITSPLEPALAAVACGRTGDDVLSALAGLRHELDSRGGLMREDSRTLALVHSAEFFTTILRGDVDAAWGAFDRVHVEPVERWSDLRTAVSIWSSDPTHPARLALLVDRMSDVAGARDTFAIPRLELAWRAFDRAGDLETQARTAACVRNVVDDALFREGAATDHERRVFIAAAILGAAIHDDALTASAAFRLGAVEAASGNTALATQIFVRIADEMSSRAAPLEVTEATRRAGIMLRESGNFTDAARMFDRLDQKRSSRVDESEGDLPLVDPFGIAIELATTYEAAGQYRRAYGWWVAAERCFPREIQCGTCAASLWSRIEKAKLHLWREIERLDGTVRR